MRPRSSVHRFRWCLALAVVAAGCATPKPAPLATGAKEISASEARPPEIRSATDVLRLHRLGVSEANLLAGIAAAPRLDPVDAADLAALRDAGAPASIIAALGAPRDDEIEAGSVGATVVVLDASRSMNDRIDGVPKIAMAKVVLLDWLDAHPGDAVGLVAFGHRSDRGCDDVEVLAPPAPANAPAIREALNGVYALGRSPLAQALAAAGEALPAGTGGRVLVVTDGRGGCGADPCATVRDLAASGRVASLDVIGLDPAMESARTGRCMAEAGGGRYRLARNLEEFAASLWRTELAAAGSPAPGGGPSRRASEPEGPPRVDLGKILQRLRPLLPGVR